MTSASQACTIIGLSCGRGARDQGCAEGPRALLLGGLLDRLGRQSPDIKYVDMIPEAGDAVSVIADLGHRLSRQVATIMDRKRFPIVIGGDHSCAIGTWTGISQALGGPQEFRLIWIDAHLDMHIPETSPSGALHGMPLACLLGQGDPRLACDPAALDGLRVTVMGVRSCESEEMALARELRVQVITMDDLAGLDLRDALLQAAGDGRFGITLDLDAIDPLDAPGVGTPVPGGIRGASLLNALGPLLASPRCIGLEIAEFNPIRDTDNRTAALVEAFIMAVLQPGERP